MVKYYSRWRDGQCWSAILMAVIAVGIIWWLPHPSAQPYLKATARTTYGVWLELKSWFKPDPTPSRLCEVGVRFINQNGVSVHFTAELATTMEQQQKGLMYRKQMPARHGMLFDLGETRSISMWMKNTFIPLDMIFIREDGSIADIADRTTPQSLATITPAEPVRYVLELNAGEAEAYQLALDNAMQVPLDVSRCLSHP